MTDMTPERLAEIRDRATWATEGPWAPWLDQDGQPHMHGLLMVGNADAVIPEGEAWVEDVDVNPIAHTYMPEDRIFIAHARTDVPDLLAEVKRLTAENARLREGIKRIADIFDPIDYDELAGDAAHARGVARDLLNPTDEGEGR